MGEGQIRCCGSSLFLKNNFGKGFKLQIVKNRETKSYVIIEHIKQFINDVKLTEESDVFLQLELPIVESSKFGQLFNNLDSHKNDIGVVNYGFGSCTLEDVFLKVSEINDHHQKDILVEKHDETQ